MPAAEKGVPMPRSKNPMHEALRALKVDESVLFTMPEDQESEEYQTRWQRIRSACNYCGRKSRPQRQYQSRQVDGGDVRVWRTT